jgi:hypothetical protein
VGTHGEDQTGSYRELGGLCGKIESSRAAAEVCESGAGLEHLRGRLYQNSQEVRFWRRNTYDKGEKRELIAVVGATMGNRLNF